MLGQAEQGAHGHTLRLQRRKSLWMSQQKIEGKFGVGGIVLGPAGLEGFAILGQSRWVDWKEHEEVVLLQRVDDRALGQFKSNRDGAAKALVQRLRPFIDAGHLVGNAVELASIVTGYLKADVMLGIRPIDANVGRERMGM